MANKVSTDTALLDLYNEVDHFLRKATKRDKHADHSHLIHELSATNHVIARNQQVLRAVAQIRNSLVHNPIPNVAQPLMQPNPHLVQAYRDIRDALLNPPTALSIAIPRAKIFTTTLETKVAKVMKAMDDNTYTHVPVIDNGKMIGIFSENTLLSYLAVNGEGIVTQDMTIADFKDFLPLTSHHSETFVFLPRNAELSKVYEVFNEGIKIRKRIGMIFVTEHGKLGETPLGVITAWDLASPLFSANG